MITLNIIGCGKLGKTIAKLFVNKGNARILGIVNSSIDSARTAASYVGQGNAFSSISELPAADVYLISTKDGIIEKTCQNLVATNKLKRDAIVMHCSGSLSSQILHAAKLAGCRTASVHPVKSFANPDICLNSFDGTFCAFEGDNESLPLIKPLFEGIGGNLITINSDNKKQYHAAMVMANNYLVTLHYHATQNLIAAGIDAPTAKLLISNMMTDAFNNLKTLEHSKALTGPIQRGDADTVKGHMIAIKDNSSRSIYSSLGIGTLPLTSHSNDKLDEMKKSLDPNITTENQSNSGPSM